MAKCNVEGCNIVLIDSKLGLICTRHDPVISINLTTDEATKLTDLILNSAKLQDDVLFILAGKISRYMSEVY